MDLYDAEEQQRLLRSSRFDDAHEIVLSHRQARKFVSLLEGRARGHLVPNAYLNLMAGHLRAAMLENVPPYEEVEPSSEQFWLRIDRLPYVPESDPTGEET